ncbi:MAG: serine hydrolase domain-containing protein [Polyangiaceae bacterium]
MVSLWPSQASPVLAGCAASTTEDVACSDQETGCEETVGDVSDEVSVLSLSKKRWQVTSPFADRTSLQTTLGALASSNTAIVDMTAGPGGAWVILTADDVYSGGPLPSGMAFWMSLMRSNGHQLKAVDINSDGGYVIIADGTYHIGGSVNQGAKDKIAEYYSKGWKIRDVETTPTGYVILGDGSLASYANTGQQLMAVLADRLKSKRRVEQVEIGLDGGWVVISDQEAAVAQASSTLSASLKAAAKAQAHMSKLMLAENGGFVLYSNGTASASPNNVAEAVEYGSDGRNIWERMDYYNLPGVSISIIENNQVKYSRGYGVLKQGEEQHILATTMFDMASLSKFVGALTVMKVDSEPYPFSVDASIVDNARTNGAVEKWLDEGNTNPGAYGFSILPVSNTLTTAHFLRHQTDFIRSGGSPGYDYGSASLNGSTWQYLLGWNCSTNPCGYNSNDQAWTVGGAGSVASSYDSVHFSVPQAVVEDATGLAAFELIEKYWTEPMHLDHLTGDTHSPLLAGAAWPHGGSGPRATRHAYPWTFAGGIYAAPMDYAELMILAMNQGKDSSGVERIPAWAINRMLQVQDSNVGFGLYSDGVGAVVEGSGVAFVHNGAHSGRTYTHMCGNPTTDTGIVIAINKESGDGPDRGTGNDSADFVGWVLDQYTAFLGYAPFNCR